MAREDKLKSIAKMGGKATRNQAEYLKFKDFSPHEVHEGDITHFGSTLSDAPMTNRAAYANRVHIAKGGSAKAFRFQGKLYRFNTPTKVGKGTAGYTVETS